MIIKFQMQKGYTDFKKHIKYSKLEFVWKRCYMIGNLRFYMLKDKKNLRKLSIQLLPQSLKH